MEKYLPRELWYETLSKLQESEFRRVSLVCKYFLSISNTIRKELTFTMTDSDSSVHQLYGLIKRFPSLEKINLIIKYRPVSDNDNGVVSALRIVSQSGLNLISLGISCRCDHCGFCPCKHSFESLTQLGLDMKNVKTLTCSICKMDEKMVKQIGISFSMIEELNITDRVTDVGIESLSSKLKNLKKISVLKCFDLTDRSIVALSSNCMSLREIKLSNQSRISDNGIGYLLHHCPNMVSLSVCAHGRPIPDVSEYRLEESIIAYGKRLECIEYSSWRANGNSVLSAIAAAQLSLKKLSFTAPFFCTPRGVSRLLSIYRHSLSSLQFCGSLDPLTVDDHLLISVSDYLKHLTRISISDCYGVGNRGFFTLVKKLPSVEYIHMECTRLGRGRRGIGGVKNEKIQHLSLKFNQYLDDETLDEIGKVCPNLESFRLDYSGLLTYKGLIKFLTNCKKVKTLRLSRCSRDFFKGKFQLPLLRNFEDHYESDLPMVSEDNEYLGYLLYTSLMEFLNLRLSRCRRHFLKATLQVPLHDLEELYVSDSAIGDDELNMIGDSFHELRKLELKRCKRMTGHGIIKLVRMCKRLEKIKLIRCGTLDDVEALRRSLYCERDFLKFSFY